MNMPYGTTIWKRSGRSSSLYSVTHGFTEFLTVLLSIISFGIPQGLLHAQEQVDQIRIEDSGRMVWRESGKEVTGFGVNYTVPFAYAYRTGKRLGVDLKAAIDQDVYQFARLGLDLYRVHVWDCEISDTLGNLLQNEHLELFDYLLYQLKKHHIHAIITPIAYWGNGWPEPDEVTPGFSYKYGKEKCLVDPEAIRAQVNYLHQFVNHVNPYTDTAYKNDPMILAFEVCNEPHHEAEPAEVTQFIRRMKEAIRQTGCTKPVFYNVSHKIHLAEAYYAAGIDGGTFQWYPTGLVFNQELQGNMLPNVDRYSIPFEDVLKRNHSARVVYEYDAADMAKNYLYPAMARSFRTAGMQLATQFAWDPTYLAPYNTEYNTHFMNLLYAPQKALSLMICGEIFRTLPLYTDYGVYPDNTSFGPFRVSYEENLAEMVTDKKFIYTNNTTTSPPHPERLDLIAGWGNSPLVEYEGTGAYFLDHVGDEIWRLEIMPDAVQVDNLFGRNSLDKRVSVVNQTRRKIKFNLPGFDNGFAVESVDWHDSILYRETKDRTVELKPGVYLLMSWKYIQDDSLILESMKPIVMDNELEYPGPCDSVLAYHPESAIYWQPGSDHTLALHLTAPQEPDKVVLRFIDPESGEFRPIEMRAIHPYYYKGIVPAKYFHHSDIGYQYYFEIYQGSRIFYFPYGSNRHPQTKDTGKHGGFVDLYEVGPQINLLRASDFDRINKRWLPSFLDVQSFDSLGGEVKPFRTSIHIQLKSLRTVDNENLFGVPVGDYTLRHYFMDRYPGLEKEFRKKKVLVLQAKTPDGVKCPVQVSLILKNGTGFGYTFHVNDTDEVYTILLADLQPVPVVLMPRPYPTFLPYYSAVRPGTNLDMTQIESLEISIGPGIPKQDWDKPVDVFISGVWVE